ncbi:MAG: hypothetical protein BWY76_03216 [bacterium ADurb.Bin429]|nr:MAG: hypothetical protein BWY76_03216 [bacterium ADurb.Bin429]
MDGTQLGGAVGVGVQVVKAVGGHAALHRDGDDAGGERFRFDTKRLLTGGEDGRHAHLHGTERLLAVFADGNAIHRHVNVVEPLGMGDVRVWRAGLGVLPDEGETGEGVIQHPRVARLTSASVDMGTLIENLGIYAPGAVAVHHQHLCGTAGEEAIHGGIYFFGGQAQAALVKHPAAHHPVVMIQNARGTFHVAHDEDFHGLAPYNRRFANSHRS